MKKTITVIVLSTMLLFNYACKKADKSTANQQVAELYLSSINALNDGNLELFLANFAPEIKMYGTDGEYFGKSALRERFTVLFKQFPTMKMEIPELKTEELSKDVVLVNFKWKVYPMGQGPAFSGIGSGVYKYQNDTWLEILEVEKITHVDEALKQQRTDK